jgi:multiple sugar transport system substrate-binding protein
MKLVMDDQKTVAEALASMQTRLQAALDQALANQESGDAAD